MGLRARVARIGALLVAMCLLLASVPGCGTVGRLTDRRTVALGVSREALSALAYIARAQGLFEQAGLDVEFKEYRTVQLSKEALLAGEVDAALISDVPIAIAAINGDPMRIICTVGTTTNDLKIVTDANSGITKPADLVGRRVGTRWATGAHYFLHGFLVKNGIPDSAVKISFGTFEGNVKALLNGELDAVSVREPFVSELRSELGDRFVLLEDAGVYRKTMSLCVRSDASGPSLEVQKRLVSAMLAAEKSGTGDHRDEALSDVAEALGIKPGDVSPSIVVDGAVALPQSLVLGQEDMVRWALTNNLASAESTPDVLDLFDARPLDAVAPDRVTVIR